MGAALLKIMKTEPPSKEALVRLLVQELRASTGFVRVHAAEVLIEHGYGHLAAPLFQSEVNTAPPPYRTGVWRVLARVAENEVERQRFTIRLRRAMLDAQGPDRLHAVESLAKLGIADRADRPTVEQWLATADDATAAFALWWLVLSSQPAERATAEARLAKLVLSPDAIARLRAVVALGRLKEIAPESLARLNAQVPLEPADSLARVYLLGAVLLHAPRDSAATATLKRPVLAYLESAKASEQFEAATVLGLRGSAEDLPALVPLLKHREADARIGAAGALLHLQR